MSDKSTLHKWMTKKGPRYLLDSSHEDEVNRNAAIYEFDNSYDLGGAVDRREAAEEKAYTDYRQSKHKDAAKRHYKAMMAAKAAGEGDTASRHKLLYSMHVKAAGDKDDGIPPQWVKEDEGQEKKDRVVKFKNHAADAYLLERNEDGITYGERLMKTEDLNHPIVRKIHTMWSINPEGAGQTLELIRSGKMGDHEYAPGVKLSDILADVAKPADLRLSDLPAWAQAKLYGIAIENLAKAHKYDLATYDKVRKESLAAGLSRQEAHTKAREAAFAAVGGGVGIKAPYKEIQTTAKPGQVLPTEEGGERVVDVKPTEDEGEYIPSQTYQRMKFMSPQPTNLNSVEALRGLYGDRVPQDFDVTNAKHWGALIGQMQPHEKGRLGNMLFSHDRWMANRGYKPATGPDVRSGAHAQRVQEASQPRAGEISLDDEDFYRSERDNSMQFVLANVPDGVKAEMFGMVKMEFIKTTLKKAIAEKLGLAKAMGPGKMTPGMAGGTPAMGRVQMPKMPSTAGVKPMSHQALASIQQANASQGAKLKTATTSGMPKPASINVDMGKTALDPNKIKVRDETIKQQKLPPGAPGANKHGVGVTINRKKYKTDKDE